MTNDLFEGKGKGLPENSHIDVLTVLEHLRLPMLCFLCRLIALFLSKKTVTKISLDVEHETRKADGSETKTKIRYTEER